MKKLADFKFMAMALLVAMFSMSFTACSSDDDDDTAAIDDYYFEVTVQDRGTLTAENAASIARDMTSTLSVLSVEGVEKDKAEYYFNKAIEVIVEVYDVKQNFTATFKINMKNSKGNVFKSKLIKMSKNGCEAL